MQPYYYLTGEINAKNVHDLIVAMLIQLYSNPKEEAVLYISSTGGDLDSAIRFYDFVEASDLKINTVGFGQVDSAAVLLFLVGEKRTLIKNCRMRLHLPTHNALQSQILPAYLEAISVLRQLDQRYFEIIASELSMTISRLKKIYTEGKILSTREALAMGLATEIKDKLPSDRSA